MGLDEHSKLALPPSDVFRAPFVVPIGHLTMQAAQVDQLIYMLFATIPSDGSPEQLHYSLAEKKLRNWSKEALKFVDERLALLPNGDIKNEISALVVRYESLKRARNRVVHDAVEVGIDWDGTAYALAVEYSKDSSVYCHKVTPEQIAAVACEAYELKQDLNFTLSKVRDGS